MYPLLCRGGYGLPIKEGKCEIVQIHAAGSDTNSSSRLMLVDSNEIPFNGTPDPDTKGEDHSMLCDVKRVAACNANIDFPLHEPIKIRNNLVVMRAENLVPGSIFVYVR